MRAVSHPDLHASKGFDSAYIDTTRTYGRPIGYSRLDPEHTKVTEGMFIDTQKTAVDLMTVTRIGQCLHEGFG